MKSIKQRRLEFLEDTVQYYVEDVSRRAVKFSQKGVNSTCLYRTDDGKKCAIGRHIPDDKYDARIEGDSVEDEAVLRCVPKNIRDLGKEFLCDLQDLHDGNYNWDTIGLSEVGKEQIERIKRIWKLN